MKNFGICLMLAGAIWGVIAFNMKTSVETESRTIGSGLYSLSIPSQTVHNLDLADRRRNHLIGAGISLISGILLFGFGTLQPKEEAVTASANAGRKCPFCAEFVKTEAQICRFCGKDLPVISTGGSTGIHKIQISDSNSTFCPKCTVLQTLSNLEIKSNFFKCKHCRSDIAFVVES